MKSLNKEEFQTLIKEDKPTIIDFWASWCMPCKMLGPIFEEVAEEMPEANFAKLSTEEQPEIAQQNEVTGIPCIIIFHKGEEVNRLTGLMPKERLKESLQSILNEI